MVLTATPRAYTDYIEFVTTVYGALNEHEQSEGAGVLARPTYEPPLPIYSSSGFFVRTPHSTLLCPSWAELLFTLPDRSCPSARLEVRACNSRDRLLAHWWSRPPQPAHSFRAISLIARIEQIALMKGIDPSAALLAWLTGGRRPTAAEIRLARLRRSFSMAKGNRSSITSAPLAGAAPHDALAESASNQSVGRGSILPAMSGGINGHLIVLRCTPGGGPTGGASVYGLFVDDAEDDAEGDVAIKRISLPLVYVPQRAAQVADWAATSG